MAKNPSSPDLDEPKTFLSREKPPRTPELRHRIDQAPKLTDGDHRRKTHGDLSVSAERARPSRRCAVHLFLKGSAVRAFSAADGEACLCLGIAHVLGFKKERMT